MNVQQAFDMQLRNDFVSFVHRCFQTVNPGANRQDYPARSFRGACLTGPKCADACHAGKPQAAILWIHPETSPPPGIDDFARLEAKADVRPGTFIAAVGADNPDKSEIHPDLMARATVVADILAQCATMVDLHHAISAGRMPEAVHAELGDLVAGRRVGRSREDEITLFDSSGTGIQDVAAAARAFELGAVWEPASGLG